MKLESSLLKQCWFLAGPTAVGKSETSLRLAEALNAEILSLDSMAIYRRMDIGTAKPSLEDRKRIPHHLIDLIEPHEEFSTADYLQEASRVVEEVLLHGKTPLFVGGTGLYLRSVLRGIFEGPAADWEYRGSLDREEKRSPGGLFQRLQQVDPVLAKKLHPNDVRRIVRGLEVHHLTGVPLSKLQQEQGRPESERAENVYWLHPNREWLYERINRRVDLMIQQGLKQEVEELLARTPPPSRTALQGLGYKEMVEHLEGTCSLVEAVDMLKTRTRQFAKRQHTWFRNLPECRAVPVEPDQSVQEVVQKLLDQAR